jgi:MHS family proline/betaine transporter-like MFS transporter
VSASQALTLGLSSGEPHTLAPRSATILAVVIGNALEWYEIVVYGYLATVIAELFFPAHDATTSLLLAFASFGLTYLSRPLGAVVLGTYADRVGRKRALQSSIWMMVAASAAIAFVPTYEVIGIAAPAIVVSSRLLQGFSVGGEFGSATAYLAEQDPAHRGYLASWQFASQGLTALLATASIAALTMLLSTEQIKAWGWRVPFLLGLLLGPVAIYIRAQLTETTEFHRAQAAAGRLDFAANSRSLAIAIGLIVLGTVAVYTIVFLPTYAVRSLHLSTADSFAAGIVTGALQLALVPMFGALSDRVGRTTAPVAAALVMLFGAWPALTWLNNDPSLAKLLALQVLIGIVSAAYLGAMPALLAELFPVRARSAGLSISYAVGVAVFGGLAPLAHAWLIMRTGDPAAPAIYIVAAAVVSLVALFAARRVVRPTP